MTCSSAFWKLVPRMDTPRAGHLMVFTQRNTLNRDSTDVDNNNNNNNNIEFILRMLHMDMFACALHKLKGHKTTN